MGFSAILIVLLQANLIRGTEPLPDEEILSQAEEAFHRGTAIRQTSTALPLFREAAHHYEELRLRGISNPSLYRNQGNAYLLAGDLPRAILSYHRGLRLDPGDREIRDNLNYARDQVVYAVVGNFGRPPADSWPGYLPRPSSNTRLALWFISYSIFWTALTRWMMARLSWLLWVGFGAFVSLCFLTFTLAIDKHEIYLEATRPLVIIGEDGVSLRTGNGFAYPPSYEPLLNRGVEAHLRFTQGNWLQIELTGGEVGWVPQSSVLREER